MPAEFVHEVETPPCYRPRGYQGFVFPAAPHLLRSDLLLSYTRSPSVLIIWQDLLYTVDPTTSEADVSLTASPTGMWLLKTSILVTNGVTFKIYGMDNAGGDCDEVRVFLVSNSALLLFVPRPFSP